MWGAILGLCGELWNLNPTSGGKSLANHTKASGIGLKFKATKPKRRDKIRASHVDLDAKM
ncbi:hypothetical protein [Campylobacter sp. 19-13652]|uniref:hypothetical protein n=1 Tax=Campylobacter sp. 19-13652 TaxID=2840180 RepID=UPI001C75AB2E|nr:hypothetical protein [Campylobacter sp. 19-13652]BCX80176.1 hypothetical protein LBC_16380 [Campylobacter sp. 19-13652]